MVALSTWDSPGLRCKQDLSRPARVAATTYKAWLDSRQTIWNPRPANTQMPNSFHKARSGSVHDRSGKVRIASKCHHYMDSLLKGWSSSHISCLASGVKSYSIKPQDIHNRHDTKVCGVGTSNTIYQCAIAPYCGLSWLRLQVAARVARKRWMVAGLYITMPILHSWLNPCRYSRDPIREEGGRCDASKPVGPERWEVSFAVTVQPLVS